jgi:hypothetical protein
MLSPPSLLEQVDRDGVEERHQPVIELPSSFGGIGIPPYAKRAIGESMLRFSWAVHMNPRIVWSVSGQVDPHLTRLVVRHRDLSFDHV